MTIDTYQRVTLLSDILRSHQLDGTGTASEYEQAGRIAKTLLDDVSVDGEIRRTLSNIQQYTSAGAQHSSPDQHILDNQNLLDEWVQSLDQFAH